MKATPLITVISGLRKINRHYRQEQGELSEKYALSHNAQELLLFFDTYPQLRAAEGAKQLSLTKSAVSAGVAELEGRGLVELTTSETDRRARDIRITEKAQPILAEIRARSEVFFDKIFSMLTPEEREQLIATVAKMNLVFLEEEEK